MKNFKYSMNTTKTQPEEPKRKKKTILAVIIICVCAIIILVTALLYQKSLPDPHFKGDATKEEIKKFDSLKNQFDLVAKFVTEIDSKMLPDDSAAWGGRTYDMDIAKGQILGSVRSESEERNFDYFPFESNEDVKLAIKALAKYFPDYEKDRPWVRVLGEKVTFIYMREEVIYSTTGVPTYTDHPREDGGNYEAYQLTDNWYFLRE